jgi:hypothetical protein
MAGAGRSTKVYRCHRGGAGSNPAGAERRRSVVVAHQMPSRTTRPRRLEGKGHIIAVGDAGRSSRVILPGRRVGSDPHKHRKVLHPSTSHVRAAAANDATPRRDSVEGLSSKCCRRRAGRRGLSCGECGFESRAALPADIPRLCTCPPRGCRRSSMGTGRGSRVFVSGGCESHRHRKVLHPSAEHARVALFAPRAGRAGEWSR